MRVFATARSLSALDGLQEKGIETFTLDVTEVESLVALKGNHVTYRWQA